jgi:hypothetical protein
MRTGTVGNDVAYFLLSALAGQDLITGTKLSPAEQLHYAGMAAFSLATMIIGSGIFSQEALAVTRAVEELGELERVGAELARGAEETARCSCTITMACGRRSARRSMGTC